MYIEGITNPKIISEIKRRLKSLDIDFIPGSGGLEQLIEDHPHSLFPQMLLTERPDKTAHFIMQGKVAIICDGSPYSILAPVTFFHFFQSPEDSELRWLFGTFIRLIRWVACAMAMLLPGIFVALSLYHQEMIPTDLLLALSKTREYVPFPLLLELIVMEISFELIREAGLRVPGAIGQAMGVIGAIVLGQAAVSASLASPILIMIVAITGLSGFAIPNYSISFGFRLMRFVFVFFSAIAGIYGIAACVTIYFGYICSMKSFGVPYFSPVAPKTKAGNDIRMVAPAYKIRERPDYLNPGRRSTTTGGAVRGWARSSDRRNDK